MHLKKTLQFKDIKEWRDWLEKNHYKETEAWLVIQKKGSGLQGIRYDEALEEALCFGWIDGKMRSTDTEEFILRFSPRKSSSIWSQRNKNISEQLMLQGKMTAAGLAKIDEAKNNGSWDAAYTSKTRDPLPLDLEEALKKNPTAWNNFNVFANSYQNMYINWVTSAKTDGTRRKRIFEVVKRSAQNIKPGN